MPAYVIVETEIHDSEQYERYKEASPGAIAANGGRFLVRGGELFCDRELPWQAIVCGHITAALSALPGDNCPGQLAALLTRARAETERA